MVSPLERLKIILQCQSMGSSKAAAGAGQAYNGVWASLARMYKQEGFAGFMKGNGINVVRVSQLQYHREALSDEKILPYSALQFTVSPDWYRYRSC